MDDEQGVEGRINGDFGKAAFLEVWGYVIMDSAESEIIKLSADWEQRERTPSRCMKHREYLSLENSSKH